MSSVYDNKKNIELLDCGKTTQSIVEELSVPQLQGQEVKDLPVSIEEEHQPALESVNSADNIHKELATYEERSEMAMELVDDIVLKNYLTKLSEFDIVPCSNTSTAEIILFKINKMVYEKDEYATDKFISVVSAMTYTDSSIYLIVDGHKSHTDFYLGIKCEDENREKSSVAETFKNSILGQFPGAEIEDYSYGSDSKCPKQNKLLHRISEAVSVSSCVGIPSYKNSKGEYTNANFIQGIEKFASAMQGKNYTAVILASNMPKREIDMLRNGYETIYTELSAMATNQFAYSTNESLANAYSRTKGNSDTHTVTKSKSVSKGISHTDGESEDNAAGKASKALMAVGMGLSLMGGQFVGGLCMIAGGVSGIGAKNISKSDTKSQVKTTTVSKSDTHTETFNETNGKTSTVGTSKNFTITVQNKHIIEVQKRIDKQLERIEMCESTGLWSTGAYFVSYGTDRSVAETSATIFRSIMLGEQSGVETSALNTWFDDKDTPSFPHVRQYVQTLSHPIFKYGNGCLSSSLNLPATSLLSSKEVAILMGLPRKSVPGFPVVEHISLGKEVVRFNGKGCSDRLKLGHIFDQGIERTENEVNLDTKSLTQHTFVTGSTGCGKSNTVYYLIKQIRNLPNAPKFLVIEPAKGEYKDVFGNEKVYGTNPLKTPLLRINPFKFPDGVHVLEHIDRLIEIFNVCWPMYAAMPAVLKEAILNSYEDCGWDLYNSTNKYSNDLFPTFADLLNELVLVINTSAYSEEIKSNYQGSLVTRVKSLNNGICKHIFSENEIGDKSLFDENVIVDLSRIGSQETKSLIMGILIMRLNEYRANSDIPQNSDLCHITILEEAHNILKRCSHEQSMEGSNVAGKSVEMISNAIAEMRTYGEGFIIVDQSPGAVDVSAIRNTNTKIIMRLPEENDRKVAGKASGMKEHQIDEIAKLPTGVAVVYQNDWEEPVLCKIGKFEDENIRFCQKEETEEPYLDSEVRVEVLKLLLKGRVNELVDVNIDLIEKNLVKSQMSTFIKIAVYNSLAEYKKTGILELWCDNRFEQLSRIVTEMFGARANVAKFAESAPGFEQLTDKLEQYVKDQAPEIPDALTLVASQCFMRDYSLAGDVHKRIYSAWYQSIMDRNVG